MVFALWWKGPRRCGRILNCSENELGQVVDKTAPLLRRELLIDQWSGMRFCTPQLQLGWSHVGSPGLTSFGCSPDRLGSGATDSQHVAANLTSLRQNRRGSTLVQAWRGRSPNWSRPRECRSGCRRAAPAENAVGLYAAIWRRHRAPCLRGHGAGESPELALARLGGG